MNRSQCRASLSHVPAKLHRRVRATFVAFGKVELSGLFAIAWALCFSLPTRTCAQTIHVDITPGHQVNSFRPTEALGAGVDRIPLAATDKVFSEPVLKQLLSTGWQTVSYRQNTELYVEAWHWNPKGTWSDPDNKSGYFTGDAAPTDFIRH